MNPNVKRYEKKVCADENNIANWGKRCDGITGARIKTFSLRNVQAQRGRGVCIAWNWKVFLCLLSD